jgi:acyl-coenzyme A thioesterase PaaI-like protein
LKSTKGGWSFFGEPVDAFANPFGSVHGGWIAGILDSAMGCAVHSDLPAKFQALAGAEVNFALNTWRTFR